MLVGAKIRLVGGPTLIFGDNVWIPTRTVAIKMTVPAMTLSALTWIPRNKVAVVPHKERVHVLCEERAVRVRTTYQF